MSTPPSKRPASAQPYVQGKVVTIDVSGTERRPPYDIVIGENILSEAGSLINAKLGKKRCLIVTDTNIAPLYLARLEAVLASAGHTPLPSLTLPAGENTKSYTGLQSVLDHMMASGIDRKTLVIALGGGVIGDIAGLAAALAMRGLDIVQIPTTLLAQVDSSVGGKTAINTSHGKNTVGVFYQPRLVVADMALLDSLPRREMLAGYAEIVKYGFIRDEAFFRWCQSHGGKLLSGDREAQIYAVNASCKHKADIVAADEREAGERALLNFGHSFGHALEAATGYSATLLHGEAVAIGMVMAFRLSALLGFCSHEQAYEARDHLAKVGLPVSPKPYAQDIDQLMTLMKQDKKAQNGKLTLILARGFGNAFISHNANENDVRDLWHAFMQE